MCEWWSRFSSIPDPPRLKPFKCGAAIDLFTDGSCFNQSQMHLRFAAWAVILASPDDTCLAQTHIVESGVLPGLIQSAVRAELYAVLRAIEFTVSCGVTAIIWSDCNAVVVRLRRILQGSSIKPSSTHTDLWRRIEILLHGHTGRFSVVKVAAHRAISQAVNAHDKWILRHNAIADREAVAANYRRPEEFWNLRRRHEDAVDYVEHVNFHVRQVLLAISIAVMQSQNQVEDPLPENLPCEIHAQLPPWKGLRPLILPRSAIRWYGDEMVRMVLSWFWDVLYTSQASMKWISHIQLFADYMGATGNPGPVNIKVWKNGALLPSLALQNFSFKQRVKWCIKVLKVSLRHLGQHIQYGVGIPHSQMICMHTRLFAVPWPDERVQAVDKWLYQCVPYAFKRQSKKPSTLCLSFPIFLGLTKL